MPAKIRDTPQFKDDAEELYLELDERHIIYICKFRITGNYPTYIPSNTLMREKLVAHGHLKTLNRGMGYIMAEVRERF